MTFFWYLDRLKTLSVYEFPYRILQIIQKLREKHFLIRKKLKPVEYSNEKGILPAIDFSTLEPFGTHLCIFGKNIDYFKEDINWHRDLFSGKDFTRAFSKSINIRKDHDLSAKNVWELNRLQFLPHIAINFQSTQDKKYLIEFIKINESWIDANPYLLGINWYSNIEVNIRLINWFLCWEILNVDELRAVDHDFDHFVENKWIPSIYQHCNYSYKNPSKYSSANNHLISEYAGLFIAASKWNFKESAKWLKYAQSGLEQEIILQHSSGINKEEAAEYIQFITDFFLLAYIVGENTNNPFSNRYKQTLNEIFTYIYEFTDIAGNFPKYGDEDDGKVYSFSEKPHHNNFKSLLTSGAILFHNENFKSKSAGFDLKNRLLFGDKGQTIFDKIPETTGKRGSIFYKNEGHYIFRKEENGKEIYLHFDAAPLGYLSIAAHAHADALSFLMNINGKPIFVDSGTYSYHVAKEWRNYFVSTLAHNTIGVDHQNQAKHVSDTMWLDHYLCQTLSLQQNSEFESVKASHNGYKGINHSREITFDKLSDTFLIHDDIINNDGMEHEYTILFHLHPEITITKISHNSIRLNHDTGIHITLSIEGFGDFTLAKGEENPIFGWYSDSFLQKVSTTVIYLSKKTNRSFQSVTKIKINEY